MAIEIAALAATTVTSILLPYIKDGAKKIAAAANEKFGEVAGKYAGELAESVWGRIKGVFTSEEDQATLKQFEKRPDSAAPLVEEVLRDKLQADPQFAQELEKLVTAPGPGGVSSGAQIIGATYAGLVDLRSATISGSGASIVGLQVGSPPNPGGSKSTPPAGNKSDGAGK